MESSESSVVPLRWNRCHQVGIELGSDHARALRSLIKFVLKVRLALRVVVPFDGSFIGANLLLHLHIEPLHLDSLLLLHSLGDAVRLKDQARAQLEHVFLLLAQVFLQSNWLDASLSLLNQLFDLVHVEQIIQLLSCEHVLHVGVGRLTMDRAEGYLNILVLYFGHLADDALRGLVHLPHLSGGHLVFGLDLTWLSIKRRVLLIE